MNTSPLVLDGLCKTYPNGKVAVSEISLTVEPGTVFGLVGPNGAGKSTLLKLAAGLLRPQQGSVRCGDEIVTGSPVKAARHMVLMPDPLGVYTDITCRQYLQFFAQATGDPAAAGRIPGAVEQLELGSWLDQEVETLSAGWQRRLALGRVLLADPAIILLDEPAAGLDISARVELLAFVRRLADKKRTLIISSHILPELEQLADQFGIMNQGRWVPVVGGSNFFGRDDLNRGIGRSFWRLRTTDANRALALAAGEGVRVHLEGGVLEIDTDEPTGASAALRRVVNGGLDVLEFGPVKSDLSALVLEKLGVGGKNHGT